VHKARRQVNVATPFCNVALNISGYSVWKLLHGFIGNGHRNARILKTAGCKAGMLNFYLQENT